MRVLALAVCLGLASCAGGADVGAMGDPFLPDEFFLGRTEATGVFEARDRAATRRFTQVIDGRRDGDTTIIDQTFTYDDGEIETRRWRLEKTAPGRYAATSDAAQGTGTGVVENGVFIWRWTYANGTPAAWDDLSVTQRMVLHDDRTALNTVHITKFGVRVASVSEVFVKP